MAVIFGHLLRSQLMLNRSFPCFRFPGSPSKQQIRLRPAVWIASWLFVGIFSTFSSEVPADYRYQIEVLATALVQPLLLQLAPDGRIFFNELGGQLRIRKPSGDLIEAGTVPVFAEQENGFLGFALDPDFQRNQWIYLLYSPTNFVGQRLSRFRMGGDHLDLVSEKEILRFPEQRRECCHHAGSVRFAPDGCLLISTGDNTNPFGDSESYGPMDERPNREPWDAQRTAGNTQSKNGKILRIRPTPDGAYTIPDGNLFPKDGSGGCPEVFVMGCRNPWRMSIDEQTGFVYWGEVGPDANDDGPRRSRAKAMTKSTRPGAPGISAGRTSSATISHMPNSITPPKPSGRCSTPPARSIIRSITPALKFCRQPSRL